jgi:Dyp-type peroxidase family
VSEKVDRDDLQGIVASGYKHLDYARFVFISVLDSVLAREWLTRRILDNVTNAQHPGENKPRTCLDIAFTWKGIGALGIPNDLIDGFPHEFVAGMNRPEAAMILGDTGSSAQEHWQFGGCKTEPTTPLHILILLYAKTEEELNDFSRKMWSGDAITHGLRVNSEQDSFRKRDDLREPFGFRDGLSQPEVMGLKFRLSPRIGELIKTGEFVLGYENELGSRTRLPSIDSSQDPYDYLAEDPDNPKERRAFGRNGTYLVFRKLSQNVDAFWKFVKEHSRDPSDPNSRNLFAAKLVGRWPSGAPLMLAPHEDPGLSDNNSFVYSTDPKGLACPIGSHIRRANPRDALPVGRSKSLVASRRHRIIRRGRKYGAPFEGSTDDNPKLDEGLCFIAINADLRRQFEFIQQTWLNNPTFNGLDDDKDPIVGDNSGRGEFTIQEEPVNEHVYGLPSFVTVKGGGYFFLPGIRALKFLANYQPAATTARATQPPSTQAAAGQRPR